MDDRNRTAVDILRKCKYKSGGNSSFKKTFPVYKRKSTSPEEPLLSIKTPNSKKVIRSTDVDNTPTGNYDIQPLGKNFHNLLYIL